MRGYGVAQGAIAATVLAVLPVFLTGSLAVYLQTDLGFGTADLGISVAVFFAAGGTLARASGRFVQRFGAQRGLQAAVSCSALTMAGIPAAQNWIQLTLLLVLGGAANAIVQPAANLMISEGIRFRRLGYACGAIVAVVFVGLMSLPQWRDRRPPGARGVSAAAKSALRPLRWITVGAALGAGAGTSMGAFLVPAAVDADIAPEYAGWIAAVASLCGIACRVLYGWLVDRGGATDGLRPMTLVAGLLMVGAIGPILIGAGTPVLLLVGALVGFCISWGWTGVMHYAVVSRHRSAPAAATGVIPDRSRLGSLRRPALLRCGGRQRFLYVGMVLRGPAERPGRRDDPCRCQAGTSEPPEAGSRRAGRFRCQVDGDLS